ncbi:ketopantoate reductase family protein [Leekyejoonella antrihumi]|uniref:2-dehydropantoate 2-reductase n=1 Tax=Leekyejoonella antrihumi TaxID=1660198 RepID=A0A563DUN4_9MICO|nr:2-dehydropantoate 2-reductase [Leekyejoonella antrihumi]TWP33889.1 2-dehydropantoate 2-reductase [Leekyejoonella antrihumi]
MTSYAVLGPGGVGGLLAAVLAKHGHEVTCIAREETASWLQATGISLRSSLFGDWVVPIDAVATLDRPVDACFVAVKATALTDSLTRIPREAVGDALVVPFLNGVDHVALLRERYDPARVLPGVIHVESTRVSTGVIEHGSGFARISLASDSAPVERIDGVAGDLAAAGFEVIADSDETTILWNKLSFLATAALLTARYRATMGLVRTQHRDELQATAREVAAVSGACGGPGDAEHILGMFEGFNADGKTSMLRDLEAGRQMELDAIGGAVLRAAQAHGIPVPTVRALVAALAA